MLAYYFIPAIIFLGVITSYEDIKSGKIRNKWVLGAVAFSFAAYLFLFLGKNITLNEVYLSLINFAIAIAFSFLLWNFKFWSAGDGKLFIAYSALIPAAVYPAPFISFFPAFDMFVNVVVLFFIYLIAKNIFIIPPKTIKKALAGSLKKFPELLISIFAVSWFARLIGGSFATGSIFYSFVLYAAVYAVADLAITKTLSLLRIKKIRPLHIYLALIAIRIIFGFNGVLNLDFIIGILISAVLYSFLLRTVYKIVSENTVKNIPVLMLREGDIVCNKESKKEKGFSTPCAEGLTAEEVKKIRAFCKKKRIKTVPVAETAPFAPAMFAGVAITLIFGNIANLIYLLSYIFQMLWGLF